MDDNSRSVIAKEVCDIITVQIKERFSYRGHLQAADLFNKDKYSEFSKIFPVTVLNDVCSFYPMLSKSRLRTELEVIYSREDLKEIVGAMNLLLFIMENNLSETFIETSKILKIIVTTPMTTAEAERTFSTLKYIKTFLRNTMLDDRLNALAMMSINRNLVHEINNFDDKVMEKFISMKDRSAHFVFK
ncbi:hAT family C-terminal dimerization region [Popillia japonica]|uniref:HAT family C-terminal dimerization region n=1 Tax=Popillia japonica TaxID=7064 RepID=A0AAW1N577_POPJA